MPNLISALNIAILTDSEHEIEKEPSTDFNVPNHGFSNSGGQFASLNPPPLNIKLALPRPQLSDSSAPSNITTVQDRRDRENFSLNSNRLLMSNQQYDHSKQQQAHAIYRQYDMHDMIPYSDQNNDNHRKRYTPTHNDAEFTGTNEYNAVVQVTTSDSRSSIQPSQRLANIMTYLKNENWDSSQDPPFEISDSKNKDSQTPLGRPQSKAIEPSKEVSSPYHVSNATVLAYSGSSFLRKKFSSVSQNRPSSSTGSRASHQNASKPRPLSAKRLVSAVDRVIGYGKDVPGYLLPKTVNGKEKAPVETSWRAAPFSQMYDDNLIGNLDNIILAKR